MLKENWTLSGKHVNWPVEYVKMTDFEQKATYKV